MNEDRVHRTVTATQLAEEPARADEPVEEARATEDYAVEAEHARGGIGRVMRARDQRLNRLVAIKELLRSGNESSRRFLREVQLTARLQHPGIVPVYESGRWPDGRPFYVMKLVDGRTLKHELHSAPGLDARLGLLPNLIAVAETMAYVHGERIIHRDLKPSNVMVGGFGETVIIDWGLAKDLSEPHEDAPAGPYRTAADDGTVTGSVLGTPAYMAPEQARGEPTDARADVYALGAILYELLAGFPPFAGVSGAHTLEQLLAGPPRPLHLVASDAPRDLIAIAEKAMARKAENRYASSRELAADLKRFQTGQLVQAHHYTSAQRARRFLVRHRLPLALAGIFLATLAALSTLGVRRILTERNAARAERNHLILADAHGELERDPTHALALLEHYPADGAEWDVVRRLALDASSRGVARYVLDTGVSVGSFSDDGQRYAYWSAGQLLVLNLASGAIEHRIAHPHRAGMVEYLSPQQMLVFDPRPNKPAEFSDSFFLVDLQKGEALATAHTVVTPKIWGDRIQFSQNHALVVVNGFMGIEARPLPSLQPITLPDEGFSGRAFALSPAGRYLAAEANDQRSVRVWDLDSRAQRVLPLGQQVVRSMVVADGGEVIAGTEAGDLLRWNASGKQTSQHWHDGTILALSLGPHGEIASGGHDGVVRLQRKDLAPVETLHGALEPITALGISPDGRQLAAGSEHGLIRIWNLHDSTEQELRGHSAEIDSLRFSRDGAWVASTSHDHTTRIWPTTRASTAINLGTPLLGAKRGGSSLVGYGVESLVFSFKGELRDEWAGGGPYVSAAISADGNLLVSASFIRGLQLTDLRTGVMKTIDKRNSSPLAISPSGRLVVAGELGDLPMWDLTTGEVIKVEGLLGRIFALQFATDERVLFLGDEHGELIRWSSEDKRLERLYRASSAILKLAPCSDGSCAAWSTEEGDVMLWEQSTHRVRTFWSAPPQSRYEDDSAVSPPTVALTSDGRRLTVGVDGNVLVFDRETGLLTDWRRIGLPLVLAESDPDGTLTAVSSDGLVFTLAPTEPRRSIEDWRAWMAREQRVFQHQPEAAYGTSL